MNACIRLAIGIGVFQFMGAGTALMAQVLPTSAIIPPAAPAAEYDDDSATYSEASSMTNTTSANYVESNVCGSCGLSQPDCACNVGCATQSCCNSGCCNNGCCCDDDDCIECKHPSDHCRHWYTCHSMCDMNPHYPYPARIHGYYYFRPYNYTNVLEDIEMITTLGGDPRYPYATSMFEGIYADGLYEEEMGSYRVPRPYATVSTTLPDLQALLDSE